MKIFITGATGFVGFRLVPHLLKQGHEITCFMRSPEKYVHHEIFMKCQLVKGNIINRDSLRGKMENMDIIVHLSVATPLTTDSEKWEPFFQTNVLGTKNVLKECLISRPKRILCFSSTAALGRPKVKVINENTSPRPVTHYGLSKKEADDLISEFIVKKHLPIMTIFFPHIYGPGDTHDFLKIVKLIKKGILPQVGFAPNLLPMIYASDAIDAILLTLEKGRPGERYIIADDDPHDLRVIRRLVLKYLGIKRTFYPFIPKRLGIGGAYFLEIFFRLLRMPPPIKAENIKSITASRCLSIQKAKKELDFYPKIRIEEGIKRTVEWYKTEGIL